MIVCKSRIHHVSAAIAVLTILESGASSIHAQGHPVISRAFDGNTVQGLIATVDQNQNSTVLKLGYLARRGTKELPGVEGIRFLNEAADKEVPGSRRWWILKSLSAYGNIHLGPQTLNDGVKQYDGLFDAALQLKGAPPEATVARGAVQDFVEMVPTNTMSNAGSWSQVVKTLSKSFQVWTTVGIDSPQYMWRRNPNWAGAVAMYGDGDLIAQIERELAAPENASNILLLLSSADVYRVRHTDKAQALIERATPLLVNYRGTDAGELRKYSASLQIDLLKRAGKLSEAVALQHSTATESGTGFGNLIALALKASQTPEQIAPFTKELTANFLKGSSTEEEFMWVADALFKQGQGKEASPKWADLVVEMLTPVLTSGKRLTAVNELSARTYLIRSLIAPNQLNAAHIQQASLWLELNPELKQSREPALQAPLKRFQEAVDAFQKAKASTPFV